MSNVFTVSEVFSVCGTRHRGEMLARVLNVRYPESDALYVSFSGVLFVSTTFLDGLVRTVNRPVTISGLSSIASRGLMKSLELSKPTFAVTIDP